VETAEPAVDQVGDNRTPVTRLSCVQCEFLSFKNIDEWKNHTVGHWRLEGMKENFQVTLHLD
jgi:hypothetical protein